MAMTMGRLRRRGRGVVGIEAAIILIAFIIIAAALAHVVVNTGFYASQKSRETVAGGISEAASFLQLDGSVIAYTNGTKNCANVTFIILPVKISIGKERIDVGNRSMAVTVRVSGTNSKYMPNIYNGTYKSIFDTADISTTLEKIYQSKRPVAYMVIVNDDGDELLGSNEKGFLIVYLTYSAAATEYDRVKIEVKTSIGASLTVEREIPAGLRPKEYIDLG